MVGRKRKYCNNRGIGGFTLIELLVVVAILSLLVSIMLPALGKARQAAQRSVCLSNLRRLAIASVFYVNDNNAFAPVRLRTNPYSGQLYVNRYGAAEPRWQWFLNEGVGPAIEPPPGGGVFGDEYTTRMTNKYFMCPSFVGENENDIRDGAYGYNYQYLGDSRSFVNGRYTNFPVSEARVRAPSSTILVGDSRGGDYDQGGHSYTLDPPKLALSKGVTKFGPTVGQRDGPLGHSPVSARHGHGNASFVDGHAESLSLEQLGYALDAAGNPIPGGNGSNNRLWTGTGEDEPQ